jgi:hypothetical protein
MEKRINAEKVLPLLIYPDNLLFLKREVKLPHSSNEIMNNLRTRMGGTIAFEQNPMQGIALYGGLLVMCIIAWIIMMVVANDYFFGGNVTPLFRRTRDRIVGYVIVIVVAGLGGFTWIISKTLFNALRYSPAKMKKSYALMLHQGKPIKGAIVSSQFASGTHVITYQFANPSGQTVKCAYRSPRLKYKKGEKITGKNVLVWYLNDGINTLL